MLEHLINSRKKFYMSLIRTATIHGKFKLSLIDCLLNNPRPDKIIKKKKTCNKRYRRHAGKLITVYVRCALTSCFDFFFSCNNGISMISKKISLWQKLQNAPRYWFLLNTFFIVETKNERLQWANKKNH